jgi:hypothetical protein
VLEEGIGFHPAAVAATTDEARAGRDAIGRAMAADPALARRRFSELIHAEPFPQRREILNQGFDRAYAALVRGDWELNTFSMHPTAYRFERGGGDPGVLDLPDRLEGAEGYIRGMNAFIDGWAELGLRSERVADAGPGRVLTLARFYLRGAGSGIALEQQAVVLFTLEDDWLVLQQYWWNVEAGARAAGVDPAALRSGS